MTSNEPHQPAVSNTEQGAHTPGPLVAMASIPQEGFEAYWIKAQPNRAMRGFTKEIGSVNGPQIAENAANARLIAAAPELLFVLENVVSLYETHKVPKDLAEAGWRNIDTEWVKQARAAIAKARGQITSAVRNAAE